MTTLICNCNRTMPLDVPALGRALGETLTEHTTLCRREAPAFQQAARGSDDLVVACTQESRLFIELAEQTEGAPALDVRPIHFVNIRETGGWGREAKQATPKMAALLAAARLPEPEPVPTATYKSAMYTGQPDSPASHDFTLGVDRFRIPSYWVFDAFVAYKLNENLSARVNVNNIADSDYYLAGYQSGHFLYKGDGRRATLTLTGRF